MSEALIISEIPRVVVLHDVQHSDFAKAIGTIGLRAPYSVISFTDTYPDPEQNPLNNDLEVAVAGADYLFIQHSGGLTPDIHRALFPNTRSAPVGKIILFHGDYSRNTLWDGWDNE